MRWNSAAGICTTHWYSVSGIPSLKNIKRAKRIDITQVLRVDVHQLQGEMRDSSVLGGFEHESHALCAVLGLEGDQVIISSTLNGHKHTKQGVQ